LAVDELGAIEGEFGHDIIIAFVVDRIALGKIENGLGGHHAVIVFWQNFRRRKLSIRARRL